MWNSVPDEKKEVVEIKNESTSLSFMADNHNLEKVVFINNLF